MNNPTSGNNGKNHFSKGLMWFLFWPFVLLFGLPALPVYLVYKNPNVAHKKKTIFYVCYGVILVAVIIAWPKEYMKSNPEASNNTTSEVSSSEEPIVKVTTDSKKDYFSEIITDENLRLDFKNALTQIGAEPDKVSSLQQRDNWAGGARYNFNYSNLGLTLYCNADSTVDSINLGTDIQIYKRGYESYQVADYIVDNSLVTQLQFQTEDYVKANLKYPNTAKFPLLDWTWVRNKDLYTLVSHVTAKNALGVKSDLNFTITYQTTSDSTEIKAIVKYFVFDGNVIVNEMNSVAQPERQQVVVAENNEEAVPGSIVLEYDQLGTNGKTVQVDSEDEIIYSVPEGTYTVTNNGAPCKIYLASDEYHKNSSGYDENDIYDTLNFSNTGESKSVTVSAGQHLELTIHAKVTLTQ